MIELIGLIAAAGAAGFAYIRSRDFVANRLRYVDAVQRPAAPFIAAAVTTAIVAPITWALPIVGTGTALLVGGAVGVGTRVGMRRARHSLPAG